MSIASRVMTYWMRKDPINNLQSWCCYDFNQYRNVPANWVQTGNAVSDFGSVATLNAATKSTAYTEKDRIRTPLLDSGVVSKNRL